MLWLFLCCWLPGACIKIYTDKIGLSYLRIVLFVHYIAEVTFYLPWVPKHNSRTNLYLFEWYKSTLCLSVWHFSNCSRLNQGSPRIDPSSFPAPPLSLSLSLQHTWQRGDDAGFKKKKKKPKFGVRYMPRRHRKKHLGPCTGQADWNLKTNLTLTDTEEQCWW